MRLRLSWLAALPLLALSWAAHASTITYAVSGTLQTGTFSGTFSVNSTTGVVTSGLFSANGVSFNTFGSGGYAPGLTSTYSFAYFFDSTGTKSFNLEFAAPGGIYTAPPVFCTTTALCGGTDANIYDRTAQSFNEVQTASVTTLTPAVVVTPEPSSLVLLGTGILTLAGAARRRFRTS